MKASNYVWTVCAGGCGMLIKPHSHAGRPRIRCASCRRSHSKRSRIERPYRRLASATGTGLADWFAWMDNASKEQVGRSLVWMISHPYIPSERRTDDGEHVVLPNLTSAQLESGMDPATAGDGVRGVTYIAPEEWAWRSADPLRQQGMKPLRRQKGAK